MSLTRTNKVKRKEAPPVKTGQKRPVAWAGLLASIMAAQMTLYSVVEITPLISGLRNQLFSNCSSRDSRLKRTVKNITEQDSPLHGAFINAPAGHESEPDKCADD